MKVCKLLTIALLLAFHLPAMAVPQPACSDPNVPISLIGQAAVDSWSTAYDCTVVQGRLLIGDPKDGSDPITSIAGLGSLQRVEGDLRLGGTNPLSELSTLAGLENLTSVGELTISKVRKLNDITALANLSNITCPVSGTGICRRVLEIARAPVLLDVTALGGLSSNATLAELTLREIPLLTNLTALNNLPQARKVSLNEVPLTTATNTTELNHLAGAATELILESMPGITAFPVAPQLTALRLRDLVNFSDLTALDSAYPDLISIELKALPLITDAALSPITSLPNIANPSSPAGFTLFLNNLAGVTNLSGLAGITSLATVILQDNSNLQSLSGLSTLTSVGGLTLYRNNMLPDLTGLGGLSSISGMIVIDSNAALLSLDGFTQSKITVGDKLKLTDNPQLTNVRAFRSVQSFGASGAFVFNNALLNECDVFAPILANSPAPTYVIQNGTGSACADSADIQNYAPAALTIAPPSVDFGSVNVGSTSTPVDIQVTATGSPSTQSLLGAVQIIDNAAPPWFSVDPASTCTTGRRLSSGDTCLIRVTSTPQAVGPDQADLRVPFIPNAGAPSLPPHATLTVLGNGQPSANLTPGTFTDFGSVTIGDASSAQTVTVSNTGSGPLTINSITDDDPADFPVTSNCGATLAVGATCDISVRFTPTRRGSISGTLTLSSSAVPNAQKLVLTGIGTSPPALSATPATLAFASVASGASSTLPLTVSNTGDNDLIIGQGSFTNPDFSFNSNACSGQTLATGQNCQVVVRFAPSTVASITGSLSIASNDPSSPSAIALSGTGEDPASLQATPANLNFGEVALGSSNDLPLTLTNTGGPSTSVTLSSIALSSTDYTVQSDTCSGQTLAGGNSCSVQVRFAPTTSGPDNADLEVTHSLSASSPTTVGLVGTGGTPVAYINPSNIDFGDIVIGTVSAVTVVTIGDSSASDLIISSISADDPEFLITNDNCSGQTITTGNTCTFEVAVVPAAVGGISGTVSVVSDSGSSPDKVSLLANGVAPATVRVSDPSLAFNGVALGGSAVQSLTVTNSGGVDLILGQLSVSGSSAFSFSSDSCSGQTLSPGASCTSSIAFARSSNASDAGSVSIPSSSPQSPDLVRLSAPAIAATPVPAMSVPLLALLSLCLIMVAGIYGPRRSR